MIGEREVLCTMKKPYEKILKTIADDSNYFWTTEKEDYFIPFIKVENNPASDCYKYYIFSPYMALRVSTDKDLEFLENQTDIPFVRFGNQKYEDRLVKLFNVNFVPKNILTDTRLLTANDYNAKGLIRILSFKNEEGKKGYQGINQKYYSSVVDFRKKDGYKTMPTMYTEKLFSSICMQLVNGSYDYELIIMPFHLDTNIIVDYLKQ